MNKTILEHLEEIIPHGTKCYGCPKGDPHETTMLGIRRQAGDVYCHLLEETMPDGDKDCGINLPASSSPLR